MAISKLNKNIEGNSLNRVVRFSIVAVVTMLMFLFGYKQTEIETAPECVEKFGEP